ncbi:MAG: efflux transporter outer membrane subunit [Rhodospirillales bacterium]
MNRSLLLLLPALAMLSGCIRPHYQRPELPVPPAFRGQSPEQPEPPGAGLGELRWQDLVRDEVLEGLILEALENNYDVRIAAARVLEAGARAVAARSEQLPTIDAQAAYSNVRTARNGSTPLPDGYPAQRDFTRLFSSLTWSLDFWGRFRNAAAAARAELLATEEAHRAVRQTLVGQVAQAYFLLRSLDLEKEITERSLRSREESLELVRLRVEHGYSSEIDMRQAEALVKSARARRVELEQGIEQLENLISYLLGRPPGEIPRGRFLLEQDLTPELPPGLPSSLLQNRPDIREAEQRLIASHAQVAVARAAYFPAISLTGLGGFESAPLRAILNTSNGTWLAAPAVSVPLFNAERVRAGVRAAEALREQARLNYQRTVIQAFREVADALAARRKLTELRQEQEGLVESLRQAVELAGLRYQGGVASYLEYLDSERESFDAQLRLVQARLEELNSVIALYLALGGGWQ